MTGAGAERLIASDEEVEIAHRFVDLLHHACADAYRLYAFHAGREVGATDFDGPGAHLGSFFRLGEQSAARDIIEERGRFGIADEVNRGDRDVRQIEGNYVNAQRADDAERLLIVCSRGPFQRSSI